MKVGILGGGQLGRMLLQAAINYPVETYVMESDPACPAAHLCHHFITGNIRDFDAVYDFGRSLDAITIEIEAVNTDALEKLENEGVKVYPNSRTIKTIKNKILQKQFYRAHHLPSPAFIVTGSLEHLRQQAAFLPAVHKVAEGGYDGRGVQVLHTEAELAKGFDAPAVLEKMVDIDQEIAIMVAMNGLGEMAVYPAVEMLVDPALHLLDFQVCPAGAPRSTLQKAEDLALQVVKNLDSPGIYAIEMFIDKGGEVWINETAPRVHNSGHHTIEASYSSQFDMLWRVILGYPLGNTAPIMPSAIVNITGTNDHAGMADYTGLDAVLKMENTFVHLYGKSETRPGRKMGHVNILGGQRQDLIDRAAAIKQTLTVLSG